MSTAEIELVHGDTRRWRIHDVVDENGDAVDLSTGDLVFTARLSIDGADLFSKSNTDGIVYSGSPVNEAILTIDAADLVDVPNYWETLSWEIRFWTGTGVYTIFQGVMRVWPSIGVEPS